MDQTITRLFALAGPSLRAAARWTRTRSGRLAAPRQGGEIVEYALVLAGIAIACIVAVEALGGGISNIFEGLLTDINTIGGSGNDPATGP